MFKLVAAVVIAAAPITLSHTTPSHRVACAVTEDARLTDCHSHRLDYRHGGWYAPGNGPATWLRFGPVKQFARCHGTGQIVSQSGGNTSALHCKNGKTYLS